MMKGSRITSKNIFLCRNESDINDKENVYLMDSGCGFTGGKLACICLESGERFYSHFTCFRTMKDIFIL